MISYSIFIVDDEKHLAEAIAMNLESRYRTRVFNSALDALDALDEDLPDLVLLDIKMPKMDGIEALKAIKAKNPEVMVIMITAFEETKTVVRAMRNGAYDYVVKPIQMDLLEMVVEKALGSVRLKKEVRELQKKSLQENMPLFIGESKAIQDVMGFVENVAKSPDTPVLILGESGTGKELVASAIHYHSPNFRGPFVELNCAAVPTELIESELFGYAAGAFSGASAKGKKGIIEAAEGGTLFLDEVGDLSLDAQAKLLRFMDSGEFYRVGSNRKQSVKTRIVSATNKDLEAMAEDGTFRRDFYFRIGVITVEVPSLNERPADIVPMARQFLVKFSEKFHKKFTGLSPEAVEALSDYHWTGNVRELRNIIERAVLVESGPVLMLSELGRESASEAVPPETDQSGGLPEIGGQGLDLQAYLEEVERKILQRALDLSGGNEAGAAKLLKMKYSTLRYRRSKLFPKE